MTFSRLWLILFALGAIPLAFCGMNASLLYISLGWSLLLMLLAVTDWFLLPVPEALEVEREVDDKLSLGAQNPVRVRVRNGARMKVAIELRDSPPAKMRTDLEEKPFAFVIAPGGRHATVYHVTPTARGDYRFGDVHIKMKGRLGLVNRLARVELPRDVKVYPNLVDTATLGTVEYGALNLGSPLIVVLGHERCGAVAAACDAVAKNASFPGAIGPMIAPILPAAKAMQGKSGDFLDNTVRESAKRSAAGLPKSSAILAKLVAEKKLRIIAARYDLDDGKVEFFE